MIKSDQINELAAALSQLQGEVMNPTKDRQAHNYKYADLASVLAYTRPTLAKHGLSVIQFPISRDNLIGIETTLSHSSGQFVSNEVMLPLEQGKMASIGQAAGALTSYLRRYSLAAVLGIAQDDNDADMQISRNDYVESKMKAKAESQQPKAVCPAERFDKNRAEWMAIIKSGRKSVNELIATLELKTTFTEDQKLEIASWSVVDAEYEENAA